MSFELRPTLKKTAPRVWKKLTSNFRLLWDLIFFFCEIYCLFSPAFFQQRLSLPRRKTRRKKRSNHEWRNKLRIICHFALPFIDNKWSHPGVCCRNVQPLILSAEVKLNNNKKKKKQQNLSSRQQKEEEAKKSVPLIPNV